MPGTIKNSPIGVAMSRLGVNAADLSRASGVDRTLISRWENGRRAITRRSTQLLPVARALLRLDANRALDDLIDPYRQRGESDAEAMCEYLVSSPLPALPPRIDAPARQTSGEYVKQTRVFLGQSGFRRAALTMLDYLATLPPGQEAAVLCQGRYEWIVGNLPFVLQFITRLRKAIQRGSRLLVINRKGYSIADTALFAGPWLIAHLKGYIRSVYYEGALPPDLRFVASIRGYWSGRADEDPEVEDHIYVEMHTDPMDIRRDQALCDEYIAKSRPASQYGFLRNPAGDGDNPPLWRQGPLPGWNAEAAQPSGCFHALCRVPGFGIMTQAEFAEVLGEHPPPSMPEYLFAPTEGLAPGPHRVILCREDVREGLTKKRRMHEPLSALLHRRAFASNHMLAAQLTRLLTAMRTREDFQVALVPRVAFEKLQLELVCWQDSVSVGWLQNMENSVFADDKATSGSFHGFLDYVWDKMLAGWRDRNRVSGQLRKWLAGKDLHKPEEVSAIVKNWNVLPEDE